MGLPILPQLPSRRQIYLSHPFPDLVLVHPQRQLLAFAELKSDNGRIRPEQAAWLAELRAVGPLPAAGIPAFLWR